MVMRNATWERTSLMQIVGRGEVKNSAGVFLQVTYWRILIFAVANGGVGNFPRRYGSHVCHEYCCCEHARCPHYCQEHTWAIDWA
jgi:hypothetical protein